MRVLIISDLGETLDLAMRLQENGHQVQMWIKSKDDQDIGDGIIQKIKAWQPAVKNADLIIFEDVGMGGVAERLRAMGKSVIGGSRFTDRMENDRLFGLEVMKQCKIKVPEFHHFTRWDDGISMVKKTGKRYVFKPHGQFPRVFTHVAADADDMVNTLEHFKDAWEASAADFILQEYTQGIEMAVSAFWNGFNWVKPVMPNWEEKKLKEGGKGGNVGDMGGILCYRDKNKLFELTLARLTNILRPLNVQGIMDINCIINGAGVWGLEWTSFRWGTPTILIQDEVMREDWGQFLYQLANGSKTRINVSKQWCVGVSMVTLPFPVEVKGKKFRDLLVRIPNSRHIHLSDVKKIRNSYMTGGNTGYVAVATGADEDLKKAKIKAYSAVNNIKLAGDLGWFREDISDRLIDGELQKLISWGYITNKE